MWQVRPGIASLKPYSIDEADWQMKLDANERPENIPSTVMAALLAKLAALPFNRYPDIGAKALRIKLAEAFDQPFGGVQVGNGSSELLAALCHTFGGAGRKIVYPEPSFSMYSVYARLTDSVPNPVALETDFSLAVEKYIAAARDPDVGLAILCNPNNPTGCVMPPAAIETIVSALSCPVVVDEAYYEFYGQSAIGLLSRYPNLVIVRTFSKAYGLAAARVGYMLADAGCITAVTKTLLPYHVNALSLAAAETVFDLRHEFEDSIAQTVSGREHLAGVLRRLPGIRVYQSNTNFLLVKTDNPALVKTMFAAKGIGVRDFSGMPGLSGCLRITVGTPAENEAILSVFSLYSGKQE